MFPFAGCQLETAQFITTGDICVQDLWFIPDLGIYAHGWHLLLTTFSPKESTTISLPPVQICILSL
jgi:hypothetical protein